MSQFDLNIKHRAGKYPALTDYSSYNPVAEAEVTEKFEDEEVTNSINPFLNNNSKYGISRTMNEPKRAIRTF